MRDPTLDRPGLEFPGFIGAAGRWVAYRVLSPACEINSGRSEWIRSSSRCRCQPPLPWFTPGPIPMRGGAARQFASGRLLHRGIQVEATWRKSVEEASR